MFFCLLIESVAFKLLTVYLFESVAFFNSYFRYFKCFKLKKLTQGRYSEALISLEMIQVDLFKWDILVLYADVKGKKRIFLVDERVKKERKKKRGFGLLSRRTRRLDEGADV